MVSYKDQREQLRKAETPGMVVHTFNPSRGNESEFEASLVNLHSEFSFQANQEYIIRSCLNQSVNNRNHTEMTGCMEWADEAGGEPKDEHCGKAAVCPTYKLRLVFPPGFETGFLCVTAQTWNSLCRPGWPQTQRFICL